MLAFLFSPPIVCFSSISCCWLNHTKLVISFLLFAIAVFFSLILSFWTKKINVGLICVKLVFVGILSLSVFV